MTRNARRWWALLFVSTLVGSLLAFGGASAQAAAPHIALPPWAGPPTSTFTVSGTSFGPTESVAITWDGATLAPGTTDASGAFSATETVPASAPAGVHVVRADGQVSGLSATASFTVATGWYQFVGRPEGRTNTFENVLSRSTVPALAQTWAAPTGGAVDSSAAISTGVVVAGSRDGKLYGFSESTGAVLWSAATGGAVTSSPAIVGSTVVVGSQGGAVKAFNLTTGALLWTRTTGGAVESSPTIASGVVYIGSDDGSVYALNQSTGAVIWSKALGSPVRSSPGIAAGNIYVGADNGNVYALSTAAGNVVWTVATGGAVVSSPAVVGGYVYVGSASGSLYSIKVVDGTVRWTHAVGSSITSSPSVSGTTVYVGSAGSTLDAVSTTTGALLWHGTMPAAVGSSPFTANGVVYAGSADGTVAAFAAAGCGTSPCSPLWSGSVGTALASSPIVADGSLIIGSGDGSLHLLSLAVTGPTVNWPGFLNGPAHSSYNPAATAITLTNASSLQQVWRWVPDLPTMKGQSNGSVTASPTVVNHRVYVGANTGVFYAIDERTGAVIWKRFLGFQPHIGCPAIGFVSTATVVPDPSTGVLTVYVAAPDGYLYAMDAGTGATVWRSVIAIPSTTANDYFNWSSPTVANGKIYVGVSSNCDNPLAPYSGERAYNQSTGTQIGSYNTLPAKKTGASVISSSAVDANGNVFITSGNAAGGALIGDAQSVVRLDGSTLARLDGYQVPVPDHDADFIGSPTVFQANLGGVQTEMVGACNKDGIYYAFNANNLAAGPVWQRQVGAFYANTPGDSQCDGAAVWDGSRLFVAADDTTVNGVSFHGSIRQLDPATGAIVWETGLAGEVVGSSTMNGSGVIAVPAFDTEGGGKYDYLIDAATGAILTKVDTGGKLDFGQPVFADNLLLVPTWGRGVIAYHPTPGVS